jgi:hypothetical protein
MDTPRAEWLNSEPGMGIELEYEYVDLDNLRPNTDFWNIAGDGSLRHAGVELVSRPLRINEIEEALDVASEIVTRTGAEATVRCGLHVHYNLRPYTIGQVWSLVTLVALMEPTIYQTYALDRQNSSFALPLMYNDSQVGVLNEDINALRRGTNRPVRSVNARILGMCKYSALNMGANLAMFGTAEFRYPYCSNDFDAIRSWVDFIHRIGSHAVSFSDPVDMLDQYERGGIEELQELLLNCQVNVDPDMQDMAEDAAYFIAGHEEAPWQSLEWELPTLEVA